MQHARRNSISVSTAVWLHAGFKPALGIVYPAYQIVHKDCNTCTPPLMKLWPRFGSPVFWLAKSSKIVPLERDGCAAPCHGVGHFSYLENLRKSPITLSRTGCIVQSHLLKRVDVAVIPSQQAGISHQLSRWFGGICLFGGAAPPIWKHSGRFSLILSELNPPTFSSKQPEDGFSRGQVWACSSFLSDPHLSTFLNKYCLSCETPSLRC